MAVGFRPKSAVFEAPRSRDDGGLSISRDVVLSISRDDGGLSISRDGVLSISRDDGGLSASLL